MDTRVLRMNRTRRDRSSRVQTRPLGNFRPRGRPIILLLLGVSLASTSVFVFTPVGSAQDPVNDRIECGQQPPDDFVLFCLAFESVVENFVEAVVVADLAEAARQGVIRAELAPRTTRPPPCALPAPEFEDVCAEIDRVEDTGAAALAAAGAMLESLNDRNTRLVQPTSTRRFFNLLNADNSRAGIGIEFALWGSDGNPCSTPSDTCLLTIIEVYPGSPADVAGLTVGDVIVEYGKTVSEHSCSALLDLDHRDFPGESVTIVIRRDSVDTHFTLATTEVVDPLVASRIVDDGIGYIRLDVFAAEAAALFEEHLINLLDAGVGSIVVDLRNNPGGYLGVTEEIVGLFLETGDLSHRTQSVRMDLSFFADSDGIASDVIALPMAVVANGGSASGSELFLLAVRGNGRARIIGATTFGKSTAQLTFIGRSADGSLLGSVRVTTLNFFGPDGVSAEGGIEPDTISETSDCAHPVGVARDAVASLIPRVSQLAFNSTPVADAYEPGEQVTVSVRFDAPIVVDASNGEPFLDLAVGTNLRQAAYAGTSTENGISTIGFEYTIDKDADHDGISIGADSINLNGATIRRATTGWDALLEHEPLPADPAQTVATDPEWFFSDISDTPFVDAVNWLRHSAITTGCGPGVYCGDQPVTRGQTAAFLNRALQLPAAEADYFTDDDNSTFEDHINRLRQAGITTGCRPGVFCGDQPVTRGQTAAFLNRALQLPVAEADYFTDDDNSTFEDHINRLRQAGITTGCGPGVYCGDQPVTRGQMAAFLYRARDLIEAARGQQP